MDTPSQLKRVKRKIKRCQNPLFEKWLKEWKDEAKKNGSEMQYCFNKALKSLQKFPFKLNSGKECIILESFGSKICGMLDDKLKEYKTLQPDVPNTGVMEINSQLCDDSSIKSKRIKKADTVFEDKLNTNANSKTTSYKTTNYIPETRSGAYAILIAMFEKIQENNFCSSMTKSDIQKFAQIHCDVSFTVPKPGSYYTAWSAMGVLIKKKLVTKSGKPVMYSLTESGTDLAIKLKLEGGKTKTSEVIDTSKPEGGCLEEVEIDSNFEENKSPKNCKSPLKYIPKIISQSPSSTQNNEELFLMPPKSFQVLLIIDNMERDNKNKEVEHILKKKLMSRKISFEFRHLKVGDFIWVAKNNSGQELVLPYIVERKRMDDLASSIKDGRFHEQKFRLKQSGLENLIYLVEKYGNEHQRLGLPYPTLMQAICNTQVLDKFIVKITQNHSHSIKYLSSMTQALNSIFEGKTLMSCKKSNISPINLSDDLVPLMTFNEFNEGSIKNKKLTVRDMLIKHLLQLHGMSVEKAKSITRMYPTPKVLMNALKNSNGEKNISKLTYGSLGRSIGPVTAKQINTLYTSMVLK